jgi:alpha-tectorin
LAQTIRRLDLFAVRVSPCFPCSAGATPCVSCCADDCSYGPFSFAGPPFRFFGKAYRSFFLNNNGLITFDAAVSAYIPSPFPIIGSYIAIAPFWADVDTRATSGVGSVPGLPPLNRVYYRVPAVPLAGDVARMAYDVANAFPTEPPFTATVVGVFTWFAVGRYNSKTDGLNTFQAAIASDPRE